jgi:hypothetical protein
MTKRKRTPSSSPPPRARVPFQIPASLQRLSMISRSLAHQSDKLAGVNQDDENGSIIAQAQAPGDVPYAVAANSAGADTRDGRDQGFRAFAPRKQPSFPDAQTWVEPKPRGSHIPDDAGFMPPTQPSIPPGQAWPQPQPRKVIPWPQLQPQKIAASAPGTAWMPPPMPSEATLATLETPRAEGETLCLETQPERIAALIAQKRAANEANRRREAWTLQAAAHRISSQAPDDQLLNELNSALGQSSTADNFAQRHASTTNHTGRAGTGEHQAVRHPEQYVTPTAAITFDPVVPSAAIQADTTTTAQRKKGSMGSRKPTRGQTSLPSVNSIKETSSHNHDSLFSSSGSLSPSPAEPPNPGGQGQLSAQQPNRQGSFIAQLPAVESTALPVDRKATQPSSNSAKPKSNSRHPDTSFVRQPRQSNYATPVAAGYYRFNPRHWQTSSSSQQQEHSQASTPAAQSGYQHIEANTWPVSHDMPQKVPPNSVFRNLTQDKFGRFGVGGKLKEAVGQQSGAGTS